MDNLERMDSAGQKSSSGKIAVVAILIATIAAIATLVYVRVAMDEQLNAEKRERSLVSASPPVGQVDSHAKARALVSSLVYSFVAFLAFLVGSFVMIRLGRMALARSSRRSPTPYVDAWSQGRVTPDQIAEATRESDQQQPPDGNSAP